MSHYHADLRPELERDQQVLLGKIVAGTKAKAAAMTTRELALAKSLGELGVVGLKGGKQGEYYALDAFVVTIESDEVEAISYVVLASDTRGAKRIAKGRRREVGDITSSDVYFIERYSEQETAKKKRGSKKSKATTHLEVDVELAEDDDDSARATALKVLAQHVQAVIRQMRRIVEESDHAREDYEVVHASDHWFGWGRKIMSTDAGEYGSVGATVAWLEDD